MELEEAISLKADSIHSHVLTDVTGLEAALDEKAELTHTHIVSDVTGLQTALDAKAPTSHTHAPADLTQSGATLNQILAWNGSVWAPATAAGGSDPWIVVKLASNFPTTSSTAVNVTNFFFTPAANKTYLVLGYLLLETNTATVGPRPGFTWPGGMTNGASNLWVPNSATASTQAWGVDGTEDVAASTGIPAINQSYLSLFTALLVMGSSPTGNFQMRLRSETAGTEVRMMANSCFMYREL